MEFFISYTFLNEFYEIIISLQFHVNDDDFGVDGDVNVKISSGNIGSTFNLTRLEDDYILYLQKKLTYISLSYTLVITAEDSSVNSPRRISTAIIKINVDFDNIAPSIISPHCNYVMVDYVPSGYEVGTLMANDTTPEEILNIHVDVDDVNDQLLFDEYFEFTTTRQWKFTLRLKKGLDLRNLQIQSKTLTFNATVSDNVGANSTSKQCSISIVEGYREVLPHPGV